MNATFTFSQGSLPLLMSIPHAGLRLSWPGGWSGSAPKRCV